MLVCSGEHFSQWKEDLGGKKSKKGLKSAEIISCWSIPDQQRLLLLCVICSQVRF